MAFSEKVLAFANENMEFDPNDEDFDASSAGALSSAGSVLIVDGLKRLPEGITRELAMRLVLGLIEKQIEETK